MKTVKVYRTERKQQFAKQLRTNMTDAETILWSKLKHRQTGLRVKSQYIVLGFIIDFCIPRLKIAIEVDGKYHENKDQKKYDKERTAALSKIGYVVFRFSNEEVINNVEIIVSKIKKSINSRTKKWGIIL
jgi:leucyl-tRNA synthetase